MKTETVRTITQIINECLINYHSHELPNIDLVLKLSERTHPHTLLLALLPFDTKFATASRLRREQTFLTIFGLSIRKTSFQTYSVRKKESFQSEELWMK